MGIKKSITVFFATIATLWAHAVAEGRNLEVSSTCMPLSADSIKVRAPAGASGSLIYGQFTVDIPPGVKGVLERNQPEIENSNLRRPTLSW